jgi:hypothetical protein
VSVGVGRGRINRTLQPRAQIVGIFVPAQAEQLDVHDVRGTRSRKIGHAGQCFTR